MDATKKEVKYQKCFALQYVKCLNCKQQMQPRLPISCVDNGALHAAAMQMHSSTKIICGDPLFIIGYVDELTDTRILAKAISSNNGNGENQP